MIAISKASLGLYVFVACLEITASFVARNSLQSSYSTGLSSLKSASHQEIFIVSFDGVLANTAEWRVRLGMQAALRTWPHLMDIMTEDKEWLSNKMLALSHAMEERVGTSLTCEFALLARMLMEEQALDQGRSVGLNGKYASKFHPSASASEQKQEERKNGSRPLTVGEISVNWSDGACLSETLMVKYNIDGKSPFPVLQANIEEIQDDDLPAVNAVVCDALSQSMGNVIVTVGHESELAILQNALKGTPLGLVSVSSTEKALETKISLVPSSETRAIRQLLTNAPKDSTVYVVNSCWKTLQKAKSLFGDNVPRGGSLARAAIGNSVKLSLNLPDWAGSHSQRNDAEMDPWTNLISEDQFTELVSARIVTDK